MSPAGRLLQAGTGPGRDLPSCQVARSVAACPRLGCNSGRRGPWRSRPGRRRRPEPDRRLPLPAHRYGHCPTGRRHCPTGRQRRDTGARGGSLTRRGPGTRSACACRRRAATPAAARQRYRRYRPTGAGQPPRGARRPHRCEPAGVVGSRAAAGHPGRNMRSCAEGAGAALAVPSNATAPTPITAVTSKRWTPSTQTWVCAATPSCPASSTPPPTAAPNQMPTSRDGYPRADRRGRALPALPRVGAHPRRRRPGPRPRVSPAPLPAPGSG